MKRLRDDSHECTKSELDLLLTPETQTAVINGKWIEIKNQGTLDGDGPIMFHVAGDGEKYLDLANSYVYFQVQLLDGKTYKPIVPAANISTTNLFLHSMFSQLEIMLNDTLITQSTNIYPYRAMIETLLNYSQDSKESYLTSSLFYKDTAGKMENIDNTNSGYVKRKEFAKEGNIFDVYGRLHGDIFFQDRFLINNVPLTIKLTRHNPEFCLIGADKYKDSTNAEVSASYAIKFHQATLYLRQATLNPEVLIGHAMAMEKTNAKYPIKKVEMKMFNMSTGLTSYNQTVTLGTMPSRIVFGMIDADAYTGKYTKNPFNFKHFDVSSVSFTINGEAVPHSRIKMNFEKGQTLLGYNSLFTGIDKIHEGNNISRSDYNDGYTLFAFDLTSDLCSGNHLDLVDKGNLVLEMDFAKPLPNPVSCVMYFEYQQIIEINRDRKIIMDYST
jgi:hypothetical protein